MSASGKKKNKFKTVSLNEFLTDDKGSKPAQVYMPAATSSWADEVANDVDDETDYGSAKAVNIAALPTAPRAARGPDVDMDRVPASPPFTAFLGNIPFDIDIDTIEKFFRGFKIVNIRLPEESGRMKGFGYVEFEDRQMLVEALGLNDSMLKNRKVRIDLAGQSQDGKDRGHGGGRDREDGGEDRTLGDWRRSNKPSAFDTRSDNRDRFDDRSSGDRYSSGGRFEDRGFGGGRDDRYRDGGDRGGSWGHDRSRFDDRGDDRRSFGSGFRDDRGFRRDDRPPQRDRYQLPRDGDRYAPRDDYAPPKDRLPDDRDGPRERPRLNLQPRSKPKEAETPAAPAETKSSSIFGGARPVNTADRDREIEERLARQKDIERHDDKDKRGQLDKPRNRQDSVDSEEGRGPRRERKLSSSSSGKGIRTVAPPPTASSRVRSESSRTDEEEVFEEKEAKKEKVPETKLVPAPPPKENVWQKRKTVPAKKDDLQSERKENASPPAKAPPRDDLHEKRQPMSDSNNSKGKFVPAEAPRANVWDKKKKEKEEPRPKREKPLPQSIDEMPKYEEAKSKDFSDSNKFAGLLEDEDTEE